MLKSWPCVDQKCPKRPSGQKKTYVVSISKTYRDKTVVAAVVRANRKSYIVFRHRADSACLFFVRLYFPERFL